MEVVTELLKEKVKLICCILKEAMDHVIDS